MSGLYDNTCYPLPHLVPTPRSLHLDVLYAHSPSPHYPDSSITHCHSYRTPPPQNPDTSS